MRISGVGYSPYVYNANSISSVSMNPIESIEEDVLSSGVDYSGLSEENENPLRMGETRNFADVIASQMAMSARNAIRVMPQDDASSYMQGKNDEIAEGGASATAPGTTDSPDMALETEFVEAMDELIADDMQMVTEDVSENSADDMNTEGAEEVTGGMAVEQEPSLEKMEPVGNTRADGYSDQISLYQRLHAAQAYESMMAS